MQTDTAKERKEQDEDNRTDGWKNKRKVTAGCNRGIYEETEPLLHVGDH